MHCRDICGDKDACVAVMLLCGVAAFYKEQGKTLWDAMLEMYEKYGYYKEGLATLTLKGGKGAEEIKARMEKMRRPGFAALKRLFWSSKEIRGEDGFI